MSLNNRKNSKSSTFSFENGDLSTFKHSSKAHCASNNWPLWTQKYQKNRLFDPTELSKLFQKGLIFPWSHDQFIFKKIFSYSVFTKSFSWIFRKGCGLRNYPLYWLCIWSVLNIWNSTIATSKYRTELFFPWSWDFSTR